MHLQLHGFSVFIDVEKLEAGKFKDKLIQSIMEARNFVLVLSAGALDRCVQDDDCKDWVHKVSAGPGAPSWPVAQGSASPFSLLVYVLFYFSMFLLSSVYFFKLEDNCFTILCWLLLYNVNRSELYRYVTSLLSVPPIPPLSVITECQGGLSVLHSSFPLVVYSLSCLHMPATSMAQLEVRSHHCDCTRTVATYLAHRAPVFSSTK